MIHFCSFFILVLLAYTKDFFSYFFNSLSAAELATTFFFLVHTTTAACLPKEPYGLLLPRNCYIQTTDSISASSSLPRRSFLQHHQSLTSSTSTITDSVQFSSIELAIIDIIENTGIALAHSHSPPRIVYKYLLNSLHFPLPFLFLSYHRFSSTLLQTHSQISLFLANLTSNSNNISTLSFPSSFLFLKGYHSTKPLIMAPRILSTLLYLLAIAPLAHSHSWVEELDVVASNGSFTGEPGYIRGHVSRTAQGFNDDLMTSRLPPNGRPANVGIIPSDHMCMPSQRNQQQTEGWPRLEAKPGDVVALLYRENGHVTLPDTQPGKPKNRGTVHVYGTSKPRPDDKFLDIHGVWNQDGTGGDGRGKLLSRQNFDDGRCYQINGDRISTERQQKYPHVPDEFMGADVACQHVLRLPSDAVPGNVLSMYFVWDWPTAPGVDPNLPHGKTEIYTSCMDIDIVASKSETATTSTVHYIDGQPLNRAAVPSLLTNLCLLYTSPSPRD